MPDLLLAAVYIHLQAIASHGCRISFKRKLSKDRKSEQMMIRVEGTGQDGEKFWHCAVAPWPCHVDEDICVAMRLLRTAVEQNCYPMPRLPRD